MHTDRKGKINSRVSRSARNKSGSTRAPACSRMRPRIRPRRAHPGREPFARPRATGVFREGAENRTRGRVRSPSRGASAALRGARPSGRRSVDVRGGRNDSTTPGEPTLKRRKRRAPVPQERPKIAHRFNDGFTMPGEPKPRRGERKRSTPRPFSFVPGGTCSLLIRRPSDESLGYFRDVPIGTDITHRTGCSRKSISDWWSSRNG